METKYKQTNAKGEDEDETVTMTEVIDDHTVGWSRSGAFLAYVLSGFSVFIM